MPYAEFFSRCRQDGICYDMQDRVGTAFNVVDAFASGVIGVMTVGKSPVEAFAEMRNVLDFVAALTKVVKKKSLGVPPALMRRANFASELRWGRGHSGWSHGMDPRFPPAAIPAGSTSNKEQDAKDERVFLQVQAVIRFLTERLSTA